MRKQDYLVSLIAGLEPNEKRYFKLFCGLQPGQKRYLKLFDALEQKTKYEGAELCAELGLEPWQLADDKHYLSQVLLQSLRNYDWESSERSLLRNLKENIHVLMHRRMFSYALDVIEKTLKQAWLLEDFEIVEEVLKLRSLCRQSISEHPQYDDTLQLYKLAMEQNYEVAQMLLLRSEAKQLQMTGASPDKFKDVLNHPLVKSGNRKLKTLTAKSMRFEVLTAYFVLGFDNHALAKLAKEEKKLYDKCPQIKQINPYVYFSNLFRLANAESNIKRRQVMVLELQKELDNQDIKISYHLRESHRWFANMMSLWNLRLLHQFEQALHLVSKLKPISINRPPYEQYSFNFEYALIALHTGNVAATIDYLDELLRDKTNLRADMQPSVRILYVMAHLGLGNDAIIPSLLQSTKLWFKKKGHQQPEATLFFKHAALIAKATLNKRQAWLNLLSEVEAGKFPTVCMMLQFDVWVKAMLKKSK